ncbi:MAG: DUF58 domain-containing protein [Ktedonobacteraceae bacterium]|nr:DUF58 domain-containing protein [Ktedonobacteraceae bacterium]MBO0791780.1 DUF58 domain-containing protein [Ktedonobacteraceae bacterium]
MNTDQCEIEFDAEMLKKRRPWYYLAGALFLSSLVLQQPLIFLAALFTFMVGLIPELWYRRALRHLTARQWVNQRHLFFGEEVTLAMSIENQKLLPLPWLQVDNKITPPLALSRTHTSTPSLQKTPQDTLASSWLLWSLQRVTRYYRMHAQARGFHIFGPVRMRSSDPFGWLETEVTIPYGEALLVYPLIAPLEAFGLSSIHPLGDYSSHYPLLEDPLRIAGVRDYQIGDDPRRIHWKATARLGELQSKIYEPSSLRRFLVLLDTYNHSPDLRETDKDIQELTISVAASFAMWALDEGYMVGLLANSSMIMIPSRFAEGATTKAGRPLADTVEALNKVSPPGVSITFASDYSQYELILSTLARLVPAYHTPIEHCIDTQDDMFPLGTTIVLVSTASTVSRATIERLTNMRARGCTTHLILTGDRQNQPLAEQLNLPVHYAGGKEKWHEITSNIRDGTSTASLQLD